MLLTPKPSVVLFVEDVSRMTRFYQELAQMSLVHDEPDHAVLELGGIELVIHALPPTPVKSLGARGSLKVREDAHWKLCLPVGSIARARGAAAALGGSIASAAREWEARGFRT